MFALWLVLAGTERFLVEFVRRNDTVFVGLTMPQLLSLAMMVGGGLAGWLLRGLAVPRGGCEPRAWAGLRPSSATAPIGPLPQSRSWSRSQASAEV